MVPSPPQAALVAEALAALGVRQLVLSVFDMSYPARADEDVGRGSPYTRGAADFLAWARGLGFTGALFGPLGMTSRDNPSPYDGTLFSRSTLNLALGALLDEGWLGEDEVAAWVAARPAGAQAHVAYAHAWDVLHAAQGRAWERFVVAREAGGARARAWDAELQGFRKRHAPWLEHDGLYAALCEASGQPHASLWPEPLDRGLYAPGPGEEGRAAARRAELLARHAPALERYAFVQWLVHRQHAGLRTLAGRLGLTLIGDLQVGYAPQDAWAYRELFLEGYAMGAPPSRTNPEGQPWGYPVLDPRRYRSPGGGMGPALTFMSARADKLLAEFDGVRLDHPHGLVDPWVYRTGQADAFAAVRAGARLRSSPDLADHPELARWAVARPEQLDRTQPRYADGWVRALEPEQVGRYARLMDAVVTAARVNGRQVQDLMCEVLSTQPFPLAAVMERFGLGRFRVTQKARLDDPRDVYRTHNARPEDWVMLGNHDTPPIWRVADGWRARGETGAHADDLASRLAPAGVERERLARALREDAGLLVQAKMADLFACPARQVLVFWPDLLGEREVFNAPGTVGQQNWSLRVPPGYAALYRERLRERAALDVPFALALALRARGGDDAVRLAGRLEAASAGSGG